MQFAVSRFQSVTSTMDAARDMAERGAAEGTVVVADEQTAGRGRSSHTWYSPPGESLYLSLVLRPTLIPAEIGWITMVAALAMRDLLLEVGRAAGRLSARRNLESRVSIKWFNDVHLNGRKVCGVLLETSFTGEQLDYGILGIGLNVNTRFDAAPADVRARATSLGNEYGRTDDSAQAGSFDSDVLLAALLAQFGARYAELVKTRSSPAREYARFVETLGRDVRINTGGQIITGRAARIADDGALIVLTDTGERRIGFGDVL